MKETVNEREALKKAAEAKNASKKDAKAPKAKAEGKVAKEKAEKKEKTFTITSFDALKKAQKGTVLEVSGHEGEGRRGTATIFEVTDKAVYAEHSKNLLIFRSQKDVETWKVTLTTEKSSEISFKADRVKNHFKAHPESMRDPVLTKIDQIARIIDRLTSSTEPKKAEAKG